MGELKTVALAGNPNVGKSTLFNALTGLHQHTGNWPGKTVGSAIGRVKKGNITFDLADIPGTYSLLAHSAEEEVARNFLCFGGVDAVAVVCDATCLCRSMGLVLQVLEITPHVLVCVNLMDEAKRKGIHIDPEALSHRLGVPVIGTVARKKGTLSHFAAKVSELTERSPTPAVLTDYGPLLEAGIAQVATALPPLPQGLPPARFLALRLLENDPLFLGELEKHFGESEWARVAAAGERGRAFLAENGVDGDGLRDRIVSTISEAANAVTEGLVTLQAPRKRRDPDRLLTGKVTAYPFMLLLLCAVLFLTVIGANYPSQWLATLFEGLGIWLSRGLLHIGTPPWLHGLLIDGIYHVLSSVISVMLPPMAIFFPLFTLLEDVGYLPRIAYNLDKPFCRCKACGKQALTMCMGLGCNAAGVVGCRIIDSPRERLLAILTNAFAPCNGRFPTFILILSVFFLGAGGGWQVALMLAALILLGVLATLAATKLLSLTLLRGQPSSFTLELPPYRPPQVGKILIRSVFDRTLFVLGRAAVVAAPAGALLFCLANWQIDGVSVLLHISRFLDPVGGLIGLDGSILLAFLLGFPANEIVLPILLMIYTARGTLPPVGGVGEVGAILTANGWTWVTALCFLLFSLMHWPCSTTVLTVKKETGSWRWTVVAVLLPTLFGILACATVNAVAALFGI